MNIKKKYEWTVKNLEANGLTEGTLRLMVITRGDINILKRDCINRGVFNYEDKELPVVEIANRLCALDCDQVQIDGICHDNIG